tara:strand:+ start:2030 stop:2299 length:270 start_codon:yes stop_codon:yes gene_type:complete
LTKKYSLYFDNSPKSFFVSVPLRHRKNIIVIIPMNGISIIKSHHPDRFVSCNLLTYKATLGIINKKYRKIYIGPNINVSDEVFNSIPKI